MATPPKPGRAVLFALEDVLVPWNTVGHWQWAWKPLGPKLSERHARTAIARSLRAWDRRRWRGLVGAEPPVDPAARRAHLHATLEAIAGHHLPSAESEAVVDRFDRPGGELETYEDPVPSLRRLAALGVPTAAVTQLPRAEATRVLSRCGLGQVRVAGASDDPGADRLPAKAAFRAAVGGLGVPAASTLFVGALFWSEVRAAGRAGLHAVLLDRYDRFGGVEARRIRSVADAVELDPTAAPAPPEPDAPGPDDGPAEEETGTGAGAGGPL